MVKKISATAALFLLFLLCAVIFVCFLWAVLPVFSGKSAVSIAKITKISAFTLFQASLSTLIALIIGLPAAFFSSRREFLGRRLLLSLSSVPFCVPSLIVALGFVGAFGISGTANKVLMFLFQKDEPPLLFLYSFRGLIIAQGFYNFPIAMKTVGDAWARTREESADAARTLGASEARIFRTITFFQLLPSIISASLPIFIYCFMSFMLVLLFGAVGTTTLEVEIYRATRIFGDLPLAGKLALFETSVALIFVCLQCLAEEKSKRSRGIKSTFAKRKKIKRLSEIVPFFLVMLLIFVFFALPLIGILTNALFPAKSVNGVKMPFLPFLNVLRFNGFFLALKGTLFSGVCTAFVCTIAGFTYASILSLFRSTPIRRAIPMIPLSLSSVVLALGLMRLFGSSGGFLSLVLAQSALGWPLAFRQIAPALSRLPKKTLDAAKILSKNTLDIPFRLFLSVAKKNLLSAFGFCFALSAGDTTLPLVLALPKFDTLALFTYRLAGAYRFHEACASGLLLALICALVFALSSMAQK